MAARIKPVDKIAEIPDSNWAIEGTSVDFLSYLFHISRIVLLTVPVWLLTVCLDRSRADDFGRYSCSVENIYGDYDLGKTWEHAKLIFDANAGVLYASLYIEYLQPGQQFLPLTRMFSRLKVVIPPSRGDGDLHAVQYDPVESLDYRPVVAWLMLETHDNPRAPRFRFFSTTIQSVAVGQCVRE
jgi:hypothetical protein